MKRATKDTFAGTRYLDLQRLAKRSGRPTDELIQLYALECFLDRLVRSDFADHFILKGGVLLAALDARRPTRDIDLAARVLENSAETILAAVKKIAGTPIDDGVQFESDQATVHVCALRSEASTPGETGYTRPPAKRASLNGRRGSASRPLRRKLTSTVAKGPGAVFDARGAIFSKQPLAMQARCSFHSGSFIFVSSALKRGSPCRRSSSRSTLTSDSPPSRCW